MKKLVKRKSPNQLLQQEVADLQQRLSAALGDATKARAEAERLRKMVDGMTTGIQARRKDINRLKEELLDTKLSEARLAGRVQEAEAVRAERSEVIMPYDEHGKNQAPVLKCDLHRPSMVYAGAETGRISYGLDAATSYFSRDKPKHWVNL